MSNVLVNKDKLDVLANAISNKSGEALTLTLDEMVSAVDGIDTSGGGGTPTLETVTKTYTATTSQQTDTITPSSGYDGIGEVDVTVDAIPQANYVSGVSYQYITENGQRKFDTWGQFNGLSAGYIHLDAYEEIDTTHQKFNAIATGTSVSPTESAQTIGGNNVMLEGAVTVNAIPSNYVGSGIARRDSTDLSANGATVTAPSGYYASSATKTVASGSASAPSTISGTSASVSTGTNTLTLSKTVSVTPTVSAGYVSSGTAGNSSVSLTASVTTKGATNHYATTSDQTIASGTYLTGTQTIKALSQTNLSADNIKNGTTITISNGNTNVWSVTGTYGGGGTSKNTQVVQGTTRTTSSSMTAIGAELTVSKTGTYDVYWSAFRSNTSSTYTYATQLYVGGSAYGSENATWSNHVQNNHLSNVSLTQNQKIRVYGRESRNQSYYIYAPTLVIVEA